MKPIMGKRVIFNLAMESSYTPDFYAYLQKNGNVYTLIEENGNRYALCPGRGPLHKDRVELYTWHSDRGVFRIEEGLLPEVEELFTL